MNTGRAAVIFPAKAGQEEQIMTLVEFIQNCLDQNYRSLVRCLEGLTPEELSWRPNPQCMSIGFIAWHYDRILDMWIARCRNAPQLWEESWAEKMGRSPAQALDNGAGFTVEQLEEFRVPSLSMLLDYAGEAQYTAIQYLNGLKDDTLDKTVIKARYGDITMTTMFQQIIWEFNQHGGQMAYVRGIMRGIEDSSYNGGVIPSRPIED